MSEPVVSMIPVKSELDGAQVQEVAGGADMCSPDTILAITASLTQSYENLVGFASHVIERVAGGIGNP